MKDISLGLMKGNRGNDLKNHGKGG